MNMVRRHLVVGANRGIGLALVEELLARNSEDVVFATLRDPKQSDGLVALSKTHGGRVQIVQLEMTNEDQVVSVAKDLTARVGTLDTVIVNAAVIAGRGPLSSLSPQDLLTNLQVNVVGPHTIIKHFSPLLLASQASKRALVLITSAGGSISLAKDIGNVLKFAYGLDHVPLSGYGISKAANNMLGRQWADVLEPKGVAVLAIHPGRVETDMGKGMQGNISTVESAKGCIDVWESTDLTRTGDAMLSYDGTTIPW